MPTMPAKHRPPGYAPHAYDLHRPSPDKRGYGRAWQKFRKSHAARVPPICVDCGRAEASKRMHLDHVLSLAKGGAKTDPRNLAWRCQPCHSRKTVLEDGGLGHA